MGVRLAPVTLLAGIGMAVGTVAVYQWWWGLLLAAAATLLVLLATPPGWATRLPLAVGFVGTVALLAVPRGEGDYLVASTGCRLRRARPRPGRAPRLHRDAAATRPTFRRKSACGVTHVPTVNM